MTFAGFGPKALPFFKSLEIAAAMRLKSMVCVRPVSERAIASPTLVDDFCDLAADALPLLT
jgi:uncharacterized protein (DUF2461 family)